MLIYHGAHLWAPGLGAPQPESAVAIRDGLIAAVGPQAMLLAEQSGAEQIDLCGRLLTPAFADAHVHSIQTGQAMAGVDLRSVRRREDVLDAVARYAAEHPDARIIVGQGWDERFWPEPLAPTRIELDRASGGRLVYLARVDVHSACVSTALIDRLPEIRSAVGFADSGLLTQEAHHLCRGRMDGLFTDAERRRFARVALETAASRGVAAVHELGGPHLGPLEDLTRVSQAGVDVGVEVCTYWGELASPEVIERARSVGALGLAGDLCVDGAIGSRTAALHEPYSDAPVTGAGGGARHDRGARYLSDDELQQHLVLTTLAGLQAGFHCIGDEAVSAAVQALRVLAERVGEQAVRDSVHRLEHVEMLAATDVETLAGLGVVASVQPAFDRLWGGPGELYATRLGDRSTTMNPIGSLVAAGVPVAFGTDAPVTPLAGWAMVQAARQHWQPAMRIGLDDAFGAATTGTYAAARDLGAGRLAVGQRANLAVWDSSELPDAEDEGGPDCLLTLVSGHEAYRRPR